MNFHIQAHCPMSFRAHCLGSFRAQIWEHQPYLGPCTSAVGEGLGTRPGQKGVLCRKGLEWAGESP